MGCRFPEDTDGRSKLEVAKDCLNAVIKQLTREDRIAIILFNHEQTVLKRLQRATPANVKKILSALTKVSQSGGTSLADGFLSGLTHLRSRAMESEEKDGKTRTQRVLFMTDMESSQGDEDQVLQYAKAFANGDEVQPPPDRPSPFSMFGSKRKRGFQTKSPGKKKAKLSKKKATKNKRHPPVFTTVIGMGVDLSVGTIERISSIKGATYSSVTIASEFMKSIAVEFAYDITPLAFDIKITFPPTLPLTRAYGSAEVPYPTLPYPTLPYPTLPYSTLPSYPNASCRKNYVL